MVMEHVQGTDLYQLTKKRGPLPIEDAVQAIIQSCSGLQHAHDRELVHRDIKPANLLQMADGSVKILDLGLALFNLCLLYTSPSPRDGLLSRMPSSA